MKAIRITVTTVGRRADTDIIVAAIAMLPALPSEEARKLPSHVSLNVMQTVAMTCDTQNSLRVTTWKRTRHVEVMRGTEDTCIATRKRRRLFPRESTYDKKPARSTAGGRTGLFWVATSINTPTRNSSQIQAIRPPVTALHQRQEHDLDKLRMENNTLKQRIDGHYATPESRTAGALGKRKAEGEPQQDVSNEAADDMWASFASECGAF